MTDKNKTALITGGAGFIGSNIAHTLVEQGWSIRILDNLSTGQFARLDDIKNDIDFIEGSILDDDLLRHALIGIDTIFHLAAKISVPESVEQPTDYQLVNGTGTLNLLNCARDANVRRIIHSSTSAIYGDDPRQPKLESPSPDPISPYAISKYTGELYMTAYAKLHNMQTISLRYFNVFGPGQDPKSQYGAAIPSITARILSGQQPIIYGDGEQTRDFCFIGNVVHANILAATADNIAGQVVNIGCGKAISVNGIVKAANTFLSLNVDPIYEPPRPGDVRESLADISHAKKIINYTPQVEFDEGMKLSVQWYKNSDYIKK